MSDLDVAKWRRDWWAKAAERPAWYVVEAVEGEDHALCLGLSATLAFDPLGRVSEREVLRLVDTVTSTRRVRAGGLERREKVVRKVPRFGRLLFVRARLTPWLKQAIEQFPTAQCVVTSAGGETPVVIPDETIEFYRRNAPFPSALEAAKFGRGDRVRVLAPPFTGCEGLVERVDSGRVLHVNVGAFGGSAPLIIEAGHVELVEQCQRRPIERNVTKRARAGA